MNITTHLGQSLCAILGDNNHILNVDAAKTDNVERYLNAQNHAFLNLASLLGADEWSFLVVGTKANVIRFLRWIPSGCYAGVQRTEMRSYYNSRI